MPNKFPYPPKPGAKPTIPPKGKTVPKVPTVPLKESMARRLAK